MLTLDLPPELERLLADMAKATGKPVNRIALEAVVECVGDWEDATIAEQRMRGECEWLSLDEVKAELGLTGGETEAAE